MQHSTLPDALPEKIPPVFLEVCAIFYGEMVSMWKIRIGDRVMVNLTSRMDESSFAPIVRLTCETWHTATGTVYSLHEDMARITLETPRAGMRSVFFRQEDLVKLCQ